MCACVVFLNFNCTLYSSSDSEVESSAATTGVKKQRLCFGGNVQYEIDAQKSELKLFIGPHDVGTLAVNNIATLEDRIRTVGDPWYNTLSLANKAIQYRPAQGPWRRMYSLSEEHDQVDRSAISHLPKFRKFMRDDMAKKGQKEAAQHMKKTKIYPIHVGTAGSLVFDFDGWGEHEGEKHAVHPEPTSYRLPSPTAAVVPKPLELPPVVMPAPPAEKPVDVSPSATVEAVDPGKVTELTGKLMNLHKTKGSEMEFRTVLNEWQMMLARTDYYKVKGYSPTQIEQTKTWVKNLLPSVLRNRVL